MFGNMKEKLQGMQQQMEEIKKRLDTISVSGEAANGAVKVVSTANRKITNIEISEELTQSGDREEIAEMVMVAVNRALEQAEKVSESEMQGAARGMMPNIPGLF